MILACHVHSIIYIHTVYVFVHEILYMYVRTHVCNSILFTAFGIPQDPIQKFGWNTGAIVPELEVCMYVRM